MAVTTFDDVPKANAPAAQAPTRKGPTTFDEFTPHPASRFDLKGATGYPSSAPGHAATGASAVGRLLDAQRYALAKSVTGESDPDKQRAAYRNAIPGLGGFYDALGQEHDLAGHLIQGGIDFATDTLSDPMTIETIGAGPLLRGGARGVEAGARALLPRLPKAVQRAAKEVHAAEPLAGLRRYFTPGTKAQAALPEHQRDVVLGATGLGRGEGQELGRRFAERFAPIVKHLSSDDELAVYRALNGEVHPQTLAPAARTAFAQVRRLQDEARYMTAGPRLQSLISMRHGGLVKPETTWARPLLDPEGHPINVPQTGNLFNEPRKGGLSSLQRSIARNTATAKGARPNPLSKALIDPSGDHVIAARAAKPKLTTVARAKVNPLATDPDFPAAHGTGSEYRFRYLPNPHEAQLPEDRAAFDLNPLDYRNPNLREREDFTVDAQRGPTIYRNAIRGMLENAGRDYGVQRTADEATRALGGSANLPADVRDAFEQHYRATGDHRTPGERRGDLWRGALGYGRQAQVSLSPFHIGNIAGIGLGHNVTATAKGLAKSVPAFFDAPAKRFRRLAPSRAMGTHAPFAERDALLSHVPLRTRMLGGSAIGGVSGAAEGAAQPAQTPQERLQHALEYAGAGAAGGAGLGALVTPWSRAMSKATWTVDDVVKQEHALANLQKAQGKYMKGYRETLEGQGIPKAEAQKRALAAGIRRAGFGPGRRAAEDLIDYPNPSQFGRELANWSKFPNYRSQLPFAVTRAIIKNPARVEAINRASQGLYLGGTAPGPGGKTAESYLGPADVGRLPGSPDAPFMGAEYARATLGDVPKTLLSALPSISQKVGLGKPGREWFYATYGKDPLTIPWLSNIAAAGVPEARYILQQLGLGNFSPTALPEEVLFEGTGTALRTPAPFKPPSLPRLPALPPIAPPAP